MDRHGFTRELSGTPEPYDHNQTQDQLNKLDENTSQNAFLNQLRSASSSPPKRSSPPAPSDPLPLKKTRGEPLVSVHDADLVREQVTRQLMGDFHWLEQLLLGLTYKQLHTMITNTVRDHEGHSVLLVGPRGSGKTAMVNRALDQINRDYPDQFLPIYLNCFIHNADHVALREIARTMDAAWRQSDENVSSDAKVFETRLINDTFNNVLQTLESGNKDRLAVIFIIDEFDKLALSLSQQTLLYNLFEVAQTLKNPMCIIGITPRITLRELLEKRVLSRFSQRVLAVNHSRTKEQFWQDLRPGLLVPESVEAQLDNPKYAQIWNQWVDKAYEENTTLTRIIFDVYATTKSFKQVNQHLVTAVARITPEDPLPRDLDLIRLVMNHHPYNTISQQIASLLPLELHLVIAACRDAEKRNLEGVVNFNSAYKEYKLMIDDHNTQAAVGGTNLRLELMILAQFQVAQRVWLIEVCRNCWRNLYKMKVLVEVSGTGIESNAKIIPDLMMVQLDVTLMEVRHLTVEGSIERRLTVL